LGRSTVVHFAGHALPNASDPAQSTLPLAADADRVGLVRASDIAAMDLTGTRTVVLSGCETGIGDDSGGGAPPSLSSAFLAAGVPAVVASLWPIADVPSARLMTALHRRLRAGEEPAMALRSAQLELLRGTDPTLRSPDVWAAFQAFGS
ncbi:MAG TPA: CHAT domain-containing protein, partial [Thermoanaerobaculia bacterium]|nr:CHAT domain-containing protein [Thermoanaerobaculia bacterium]